MVTLELRILNGKNKKNKKNNCKILFLPPCIENTKNPNENLSPSSKFKCSKLKVFFPRWLLVGNFLFQYSIKIRRFGIWFPSYDMIYMFGLKTTTPKIKI